MKNPMMTALTKSSLNDVRPIINMVRNARNPNAVLSELAKTNQNVRQVMDIVNRTGDPKSAFYKMAEAKGVDPETILSMLR